MRHHVFAVVHVASRWEVFMWSLHRSWECFERQKTHSWDYSRFFNQMQRLLKLFANCSVLLKLKFSWEDFCHVLSNELSKRLKFHSRRNTRKELYFVIYMYVLYSWWWKRKLLNKLHSSLVTLGGIIIFSTTMRQEGSGWNADRLLPEVVYSY